MHTVNLVKRGSDLILYLTNKHIIFNMLFPVFELGEN